jgi:hypothetical protein
MLLEIIDTSQKFDRAIRLWKVACDDCTIEQLRTFNQIRNSEQRWNGFHICKPCATRRTNKTKTQEDYAIAGEAGRLATKNKRLEEIVGETKAKRIKTEYTAKRSGKNNPNFGGKLSRGFADRPLRGKWEDLFGIEKAADMKLNMSIRNSGSGNPMYGQPTPKKAGCGISGHYKNFYFRSLLELSMMLMLEANSIVWISAESKNHRFKYMIDGRERSYFPDFYLPATDEYIEIKPKSLSRSREVLAKLDAVRATGKRIKLLSDENVNKISYAKLIKLMADQTIVIDNSKLKRVEKYAAKHNL